MEEQIEQLLQFLNKDNRLDLKTIALETILALTGNNDGLEIIIKTKKLLSALISLLHDKNNSIAKEAALALINVSSDEQGASTLLNLTENVDEKQTPEDNIVSHLLKIILDPNSYIADPCCMILSNITRPAHCVNKAINLIEQSGVTFDEIIYIFTKNQYNTKNANLHYLGPVLSNLSQNVDVRKYILDKEKCVIQRLLPFTEYKDSIVRRGGVVGTLHNCCFQDEYHSWLLSQEVDILPRLLLPLAGNNEYDDEDNDKLPLELQYLPEDKMREDDPDIRCLLIESLLQLCAEKENRDFIREKNTYIILRDLHKQEKDKKVLLTCENLIDILIRTEEEIGRDNLKDVDIPEDLVEKFEKMDKEFLENS